MIISRNSVAETTSSPFKRMKRKRTPQTANFSPLITHQTSPIPLSLSPFSESSCSSACSSHHYLQEVSFASPRPSSFPALLSLVDCELGTAASCSPSFWRERATQPLGAVFDPEDGDILLKLHSSKHEYLMNLLLSALLCFYFLFFCSAPSFAFLKANVKPTKEKKIKFLQKGFFVFQEVP